MTQEGRREFLKSLVSGAAGVGIYKTLEIGRERLVDGLEYENVKGIAEVLGISPQAVEELMRTAIKTNSPVTLTVEETEVIFTSHEGKITIEINPPRRILRPKQPSHNNQV